MCGERSPISFSSYVYNVPMDTLDRSGVEDIDEGVDVTKFVKALIYAGSLLTAHHLLDKGLHPFPRSTGDVRLGQRSDLSSWLSSKSVEPWGGEESPDKDSVAYVPLLRSKVTVTAYTPSPEETDDDPETAACGKYDHILRSGLEVFALSRDLFKDPKLVQMLGKSRPLCGLPALVVLPDGTEIKGVVMDTTAKATRDGKPIVRTVDIMVHPVFHGHGGDLGRARAAALKFGRKHGAELFVYLPVRSEALRESYPLSLLASILSRI